MKGKKLKFFETIISDPTITQTAAAITAGYSEKTAAAAASRLMKDPEIIAALDEWKKEQHDKNTASADEIIEILTSIVRGEEIDNIPLFVGNGLQEITKGKPSVRYQLSAAELLGKYYGMFTEKNEVIHSGSVATDNPFKGLTTEELRKVINSG